MKGLMGREKN